MNKIFTIALFGCMLLAVNTARSQNTTEAEFPVEESVNYVPQVFGAVKAKLEFSTWDGDHRFNVRNSRIGVQGNASRHIIYTVQIDFSNEGKLSVMDAKAAFVYGRFNLSIGQQQYKFSPDLDRGPNTNIYANRSFLSKFLTTYYGETLDGYYVGNLGSRDLGALAAYEFDTRIPVELRFGLFNGSGANNPDWSTNFNIVGTLALGGATGIGGSLSFYNGKTPETSRVIRTGGANTTEVYKQKLSMWGGELHYAEADYRIEAEYAQRRLKDGDDEHILNAAHVQGYYQFRLGRNKLAMDYIAPVARWDHGHNIEFMNLATKELDRFSAQRATVGVNFGFVKKIVGAELRLNYEKYFFKDKPTDLNINHLLQDKFTIEIVASF